MRGYIRHDSLNLKKAKSSPKETTHYQTEIHILGNFLFGGK